MLAILVPGQIRITTGEGKVLTADCAEGGFLSLENNNLTLVVRDAQLTN